MYDFDDDNDNDNDNDIIDLYELSNDSHMQDKPSIVMDFF